MLQRGWYPHREGYILRDIVGIVKLFLKLGANAENACDNVPLVGMPDIVLGRLQSFVNDVGKSI